MTNVPSLREVCRRAIDPEIGLISALTEYPRGAGRADIFTFSAALQSPVAIAAPATVNPGHGSALTRQGAMWAAIGEALERYAWWVYFVDDMIEASFDAVADRALDPRETILYSAEQYDSPNFRYERFDPRRVRRWVRGYDYTHGREILVAAADIFGVRGATTPFKGEHLSVGTSSGLAAGLGLERTLLSGLLEVLERDAFMCHWRTRVPPRRIELADAMHGASPGLCELLRPRGERIDLLDTTTEFGVPSFLVMLRRLQGRGIACGAGCRPDARAALERAVVEAHSVNHVIDAVDREPSDGPIRAEDVRSFRDHARYYLEASRHAQLEFLLQGEPSQLAATSPLQSSPSQQFEGIVLRLREYGHRVVAVDLTPDDVRDVGFTVVKVLVPGLQPLTCGFGSELLDDRRFRSFTAAHELSWPRPINRDLHPFT